MKYPRRSLSLGALFLLLSNALPCRAVDLDLSSTQAVHDVSNALQNGPVTIRVGGALVQVLPGAQLTAAQKVAVHQVVNTGNQSIVVGASGAATGGTMAVTNAWANNLSALTVPKGVTVLNQVANLQLSGNLSNAGKFYVVPSSVGLAAISANNIFNHAGAILSTIKPYNINLPGVAQQLDLHLSALDSITNAGTISSSGYLRLDALNSITNSGAPNATAPVISAARGMVLQSPSITNNGRISSSDYIVIRANSVTNQGSIHAADNFIHVLNIFGGPLNLNGGTFGARQLVFHTAGDLNVDVEELNGALYLSGSNPNIRSQSGDLDIRTIGTGAIKLNAMGGSVFVGNLVSAGSDISVSAERDIVVDGVINASADQLAPSGTANGGNIKVTALSGDVQVAGAVLSLANGGVDGAIMLSGNEIGIDGTVGEFCGSAGNYSGYAAASLVGGSVNVLTGAGGVSPTLIKPINTHTQLTWDNSHGLTLGGTIQANREVQVVQSTFGTLDLSNIGASGQKSYKIVDGVVTAMPTSNLFNGATSYTTGDKDLVVLAARDVHASQAAPGARIDAGNGSLIIAAGAAAATKRYGATGSSFLVLDGASSTTGGDLNLGGSGAATPNAVTLHSGSLIMTQALGRNTTRGNIRIGGANASESTGTFVGFANSDIDSVGAISAATQIYVARHGVIGASAAINSDGPQIRATALGLERGAINFTGEGALQIGGGKSKFIATKSINLNYDGLISVSDPDYIKTQDLVLYSRNDGFDIHGTLTASRSLTLGTLNGNVSGPNGAWIKTASPNLSLNSEFGSVAVMNYGDTTLKSGSAAGVFKLVNAGAVHLNSASDITAGSAIKLYTSAPGAVTSTTTSGRLSAPSVVIETIDGDIGLASNPLKTRADRLVANAGTQISGHSVYVHNEGDLALSGNVTGSNTVSVESTGTMVVSGAPIASNEVYLAASSLVKNGAPVLGSVPVSTRTNDLIPTDSVPWSRIAWANAWRTQVASDDSDNELTAPSPVVQHVLDEAGNLFLISKGAQLEVASAIDGESVFASGEVLVAPKRDVRLRTIAGVVNVKKGSVAVLRGDDERVAVYNLVDQSRDGITFQSQNESVALTPPGTQFTVTANESSDFSDANLSPNLACRDLKEAKLESGFKAFVCDFSMASALCSFATVRELRASNVAVEHKLSEAVIRHAAIVSLTRSAHGPLRIHQPAHHTMAWDN